MNNSERKTRYWIVVVSKDHLANGKRLGIVQANHGKAAPMQRLRQGDYIAFYSPKIKFGGKEPCKKFTAVARVKEGEAYQVSMNEQFHPWRREVEFLPCEETDIKPLVPQLGFIRKKESWGFVFRFGFFEIPEEDFRTISGAMNLGVLQHAG